MILAELEASSSFDYLARHAREKPDEIAITGLGGDISWGRFHADASRLIPALSAFGIAPGQIVAVSHPDRYVHWLIIIACEAIGAVSASFAVSDPNDDATRLLDLADMVLTERHRLNNLWLADVLARPVPEAGALRLAPPDPDAPLRIARTSGSTGRPKCLMLTRRMLSHRIRTYAACYFQSPEIRFYPAYPLTVNPNHNRMETCLRLGATLVFGSTSQDLLTYGATHCWLLPRDMAALRRGVSGNWPSPTPLRMVLGGAAVSARLHDEAAALFGTAVGISYGSNEAGFVAQLDRDGIGTLLPDVEMRVLDDGGQPLPAGMTGLIAVRTPSLAAGYLNDPETTALCFRDGWFRTEDIGLLLADGRFRLVGRRSEILNLGGLKLSPVAIEEGLRAAVGGISDVAVSAIANEDGIEELCVAVVPAAGADLSRLLDAVGAALDPSFGRFWLLPLEELPLNRSGKVNRPALRELFTAMRARG